MKNIDEVSYAFKSPDLKLLHSSEREGRLKQAVKRSTESYESLMASREVGAKATYSVCFTGKPLTFFTVYTASIFTLTYSTILVLF